MIPVTYHYNWCRENEEDRKKTFRELADTGLKRLTVSDHAVKSIIGSPELLFAVKKDLKDFGLSLMDAHAPWGTWRDPGMPLEEFHDAVINYHKLALFVYHQLGIKTVTYHTGNTMPKVFGPLPFEAYEKMLIRSLEELLPLAEKYGIILALENQWTPLNSSRSLMKIFRHFNSPHLGFCYDSGHAHLTEYSKIDPARSWLPPWWEAMGMEVEWEEDIIGTFKDYVVNCHFHSNDGFRDTHDLPSPDDGMPWEHIMDVLSKAPRLQCVQSEINREAAVLKEAFRKLSPLLDA